MAVLHMKRWQRTIKPAADLYAFSRPFEERVREIVAGVDGTMAPCPHLARGLNLRRALPRFRAGSFNHTCHKSFQQLFFFPLVRAVIAGVRLLMPHCVPYCEARSGVR